MALITRALRLSSTGRSSDRNRSGTDVQRALSEVEGRLRIPRLRLQATLYELVGL